MSADSISNRGFTIIRQYPRVEEKELLLIGTAVDYAIAKAVGQLVLDFANGSPTRLFVPGHHSFTEVGGEAVFRRLSIPSAARTFIRVFGWGYPPAAQCEDLIKLASKSDMEDEVLEELEVLMHEYPEISLSQRSKRERSFEEITTEIKGIITTLAKIQESAKKDPTSPSKCVIIAQADFLFPCYERNPDKYDYRRLCSEISKHNAKIVIPNEFLPTDEPVAHSVPSESDRPPPL